MNIVSGLSSGKIRLGTLCKRKHDWEQTGKSPRYTAGSNNCVFCNAYYWQKRKKANAENRQSAAKESAVPVVIYGLFTPEGECFYVGRTSQPLPTRLRGHIKTANESNCARAKFIRNLIDSGKAPRIEKIASRECNGRKEIELFEQSWIDWMSVHHNLTNEVDSRKGAVFGEYGETVSDEVLRQLGTRPDPEIAKLCGKSIAYIWRLRKIHGIPAFSDYWQWKEAQIALLGTKPDSVIAKEIGATAKIVGRKRKSLGIPAVSQDKYEWTPEILADLGKTTDREIANKMGMKYLTLVRRKRISLGIPSFRSANKGEL